MLALFRTNQLLASVLLVLYVLILWWPLWVWPDAYPIAFSVEGWGLLGDCISTWSQSWPWWVHRFVAALWAVVIGGTVAVLSLAHRLDTPGNLYAGVVFLLLISAIPAILYVHPLTFATLLVGVVLALVWQSYQVWWADELIFFTGFWIAIGALLFAPFFWLVLWVGWAFALLRKFTLREVGVLLSGFFVPCWLIGVWFYWHDRLPEFWVRWPLAELWKWTSPRAMWQQYWPWLLVWGIAVLWILLTYRVLRQRRILPVQKKLQSLYLLLIWLSALSLAYMGKWGVLVLSLSFVPLSIFWGLWLTRLSAKWALGIHWLAIALILSSLLYPLL